MCSNDLKLNGDKTHLMLLSSERGWRSKLTDDSLTLITSASDSPVITTKNERLLGSVISQNLKWTEFILLNENSLIKQLVSRINALKVISHSANFQTRRMIANGIFLSKLVYLTPLWGGCESFLLRALQTVQNKAARVVTNQGIFTSTKVLLRECGWLSVAQLVFFHSVVLLFKTRLTKKPRYLFEMAEIQENTRYGTRTSHERKLFSVGHQLPSNQLNWNSYR